MEKALQVIIRTVTIGLAVSHEQRSDGNLYITSKCRYLLRELPFIKWWMARSEMQARIELSFERHSDSVPHLVLLLMVASLFILTQWTHHITSSHKCKWSSLKVNSLNFPLSIHLPSSTNNPVGWIRVNEKTNASQCWKHTGERSPLESLCHVSHLPLFTVP